MYVYRGGATFIHIKRNLFQQLDTTLAIHQKRGIYIRSLYSFEANVLTKCSKDKTVTTR